MARHLDKLSGKYPLLIGIAKGASRKPGLETLIFGESHEELHLPNDLPTSPDPAYSR